MNDESNRAPAPPKGAISKKVWSLLHSCLIVLVGVTLGRLQHIEQQIVYVALSFVVLFFGLLGILLSKHISMLTAIVLACWFVMLVLGVAMGEQAVLLGWLRPLHLPRDWSVQ